MSTQFDHVSIVKKANIYFDGKCVSHNVMFPDGSRKTIGVIFPASPALTFGTDAPETMEIVAGKCRVRLPNDGEWKTFEAGQRFQVAASSRFEIEALEPVDYVCHFG